MEITYEGTVYEFDVTRLTVSECEEIEKFTGARGLGEWNNQLMVANTKAYQALWWVIRRHAGEDPGPIARRDPALLPLALNNAYGTALEIERAAEEAAKKAADEAAAEADPTLPRPSPSSPASAGTATTPASVLAASPSRPG